MEIPRKGRPNTWGVRTPLHLNPATGKKERYWIGREYDTKTAADRALSKWHSEHDEGELTARSDMTVAQLMDRWLPKHRGEETTTRGYEPKVRLHIKPHIGSVKVVEVTDETLDDLYRKLETEPCPTNRVKPLGPKSVRHIHNAISAALETVTGPRRLLKVNPAHTASPLTERQIKAAEPDFPTLNGQETARFLGEICKPCGNRACDEGLSHHCLRDAPLWTSYAATSCRRSEVLGWMWDLINWDECSIELAWVVVEEGGLRQCPAPLAGLHDDSLRPSSCRGGQEAGGIERQPDWALIPGLTRGIAGPLVTWLVTLLPRKAKNP